MRERSTQHSVLSIQARRGVLLQAKPGLFGLVLGLVLTADGFG